MMPRLYPGSVKQINYLDQGLKKSYGSKNRGWKLDRTRTWKKKQGWEETGGNFGTMSVIVVTYTKLTNHITRNYSYEPLYHSVLRTLDEIKRLYSVIGLVSPD